MPHLGIKSETGTMGETFNMSVKTTYKGKFASLNVGSVIEQQKDMYLRRVGMQGKGRNERKLPLPTIGQVN